MPARDAPENRPLARPNRRNSRLWQGTGRQPPPPIRTWVVIFACSLLVVLCFRMAAEVVSRKRTVAGHNLDPTPWHIFPQEEPEEDRMTLASKIVQCSYLSCPSRVVVSSMSLAADASSSSSSYSKPPPQSCPSFFRSIHRDLAPWKASRVPASAIAEAQQHASMRVVIYQNRLFVDLYYACVQSRAMFTIWGFLQLLRRYPGQIPDVDMMFDCMDRPAINRTDYGVGRGWPPPPLFRYCTTAEHFDIPFPDWSFWGWPEINIEPWDLEFRSIKEGADRTPWREKHPFAFWKGNPDVVSPVRMELINCNDTEAWGAQILRQNWLEETQNGFQDSKLSNQCNHRYKIYAEGYAWSVSLKYIVACGSLALIIDPQYEDFFSRGLVPRGNFWPVSATNMCPSIKAVVVWGNRHPSQAEAMGRKGQSFMEEMSMNRVYDYMYHVILEYSKLLDFKPMPPSSAEEVCPESILCFADEKQMEFLKKSAASPSVLPPCDLPSSK